MAAHGCGKHCIGDLKVTLCTWLARWGLTFLYLDVDVFLNADPLLRLRPLSDPSWTIQAQADHLQPTPYTYYNFGFFISRGCDWTGRFWSNVYRTRTGDPTSWDQWNFDDTLRRMIREEGNATAGNVVMLSEHEWINFMHHSSKGLHHWGKARVEAMPPTALSAEARLQKEAAEQQRDPFADDSPAPPPLQRERSGGNERPLVSPKAYWMPIRRNATVAHLTCVESAGLRSFLRRFLFGWSPATQRLYTSTSQRTPKVRLLSLGGEMWQSRFSLCLAQQRLMLLLELGRLTGRKVVLPYSVRYQRNVIPSFRFFDVRHLSDVAVEPNFADEYRRVTNRSLTTAEVTLAFAATLRAGDVADLLRKAAAGSDEQEEKDGGKGGSSVVEHLVVADTDAIEPLAATVLTEQEQDRWLSGPSPAAKLCFWMEQGVFATTVPWCLGMCLRHYDKALPEYMDSELPASAGGRGKVVSRHKDCMARRHQR